MEPVSAVAGAVSSIYDFYSGVVNYFTIGKMARYNRLPDWLSPRDFQQKDNTADIVLIGLFVVLIALIIAIVLTARKGAK